MIGMGATWRAHVEASPPTAANGHISMLFVDRMSGHPSRAGSSYTQSRSGGIFGCLRSNFYRPGVP